MTNAILQRKPNMGNLRDKNHLFARCAAVLMLASSMLSASADIVLDITGEKTLSTALMEAGFSLAAVNGGANKSSIIQKSGTGTLILDTAIPNYVAEKWIINDGVVYCKVANAFGATSVAVAVRSGATVKMATDGKGLNTNRIFYLNGTGYNNMGALTLDGYGTASGYGWSCNGIFGKVSLQGNATVKSGNHHYVGDTISLNGFTYTIESYSGTGETVYSTGVWGAGRIVLKNTVIRTPGNLALVDATASNAFDYNSGTAGIWFWDAGGQITDAGKDTWKHVFTSANAVIKCDASPANKNPFQRETTVHRIFGPVEIPAGGGATMSGQGNNGDYAVKISGAMSGSGTFATSAAGIPSICHILNPANTFTGTFKADTGIIYFYEPGTLPAGASLQFNGANDYARASGATDPQDIPEFAGMVLSGVGEQLLGTVTVAGDRTRRLFGGTEGRFTSVSKDGAGTFEYFTALDAGDVTLKNGTLKLPRGAKPGLYEYYQDYADAATAKAALASFDPTTAAHKYVMRGVLSSTQTKTDNYTVPGDKRIIAYRGYIWNRTGADRKVTILTSINGDDRIKVGANGWEDACKSNYGNPWWKTYTLPPGATEIQYVAYNGGPKQKNGWKANCGIIYTDDGVDYSQSSGGTLSWDAVKTGLIANGKPLVDPGDGSVLTLSADATPPVFDRVVGQGGTLDLNGNAFTLTNFTGTLTVKSTAGDAAADAKISLGGLTLKTSDLNSAVNITASVPVSLGSDGVISLVEDGMLSTPSAFTVSSSTPIGLGERDIADCVVVPEGWTVWLSPDGKTLSIDRQIVLDVMADTASLSAALEACGHTLAEITSGAHRTTTLVKKGSGTLTLDAAVDGYAGKWVIESGVVYQKVANAFGPASVPVYVYDGGAVKVFGDNAAINNGRSFYIAGTGCNGSGALFLDQDGNNNNIGYNAGTSYGDVYLTGDATVGHRNYHSIGRQVHLNGYTYTVKYASGNRAAYTYGIYGAGKVVCDGVYLRTGVNNGTIVLDDATPGNEIVYKNSGGGPWFFSSGQFTGVGASVWKQTYQNGAASLPQADAGRDVFGRENANMVIRGPLEVQQKLNLIEGQGNIGSLYARWKGVVSGTGTITASAAAPTIIDLFNSANTFSGTIDNVKGLVNVYGGASLPAAASVEIGGDANHATQSACHPLEFAGIEFYGTDVKTLGALTLKGSQTRRVQGGAGAWTSIVKNGSGTTEYYSALGAGKLTLNAGTFKLAKAGNVGLYEGVVDYADNAKANSEGFLGSAYPHDYVVRGPIATAQLKGQNYPTVVWNRLITYDGYFWNRTGETQTYAFIGNFGGHAKLTIDGQVVFNITTSGQAMNAVSLAPGAHTFQFRGNYPAPASNNLGLGWKLGEATSTLADYTQMLDPGDGSMFTLTATDVQPAFEEITGTSSDAFLDLNGTSFKAAKLGGSFTIGSSAEGGRLDLTDGLAVDASEIAAGDTVTVNVPVDFGSTGKVNVTGLAALSRGAHTLIRASAAIDFGGRDVASCFTVDDTQWAITLDDGGKSIVLKRRGLWIVIR